MIRKTQVLATALCLTATSLGQGRFDRAWEAPRKLDIRIQESGLTHETQIVVTVFGTEGERCQLFLSTEHTGFSYEELSMEMFLGIDAFRVGESSVDKDGEAEFAFYPGRYGLADSEEFFLQGVCIRGSNQSKERLVDSTIGLGVRGRDVYLTPGQSKGLRGEPGPQGEKGPRGEKGPQGERGKPGAMGEQGDKGEIGEPGPQGAAGVNGERGEKGEPGDKGPVGDPGPKGERGDQGRQGERGPKGEPGEKGKLGDKGPKGDPGERGERGQEGEKGPRGEQGERGFQGPSGLVGDKGERGDKGPRGEMGPPGKMGEKGEQGPKGQRGVSGEKGEKGDRGDPGEGGLKGQRGDRGEKGERGDKGPRGDKGSRGDKGRRGERGSRGKEGPPGQRGQVVFHSTQGASPVVHTSKGGRTAGTGIPVGGILILMSDGEHASETPRGFLLCDGSEKPRQQYPALFETIGDLFGPAQVEGLFKLPDQKDILNQAWIEYAERIYGKEVRSEGWRVFIKYE